MARIALLVPVLALLTGPALAARAAAATPTSVRPVADSAVSSQAKRRTAGHSPVLRVGPGRHDRAYLRFVVPGGLEGPVQSAILRVRAVAARRAGLDVYALPASVTWSERRLRFANAPRGGRLVARTKRVRRGWVRIRLDAAKLALASGHQVNLAIAARRCSPARCHRRSLRLTSREVRRRAPRLVIVASPRAAGPPASPAPPSSPAPPPSPHDATAPAVAVTAPAIGTSTDGQPIFSGTAEPGRVTVQVAPAAGGAPVATYIVAVAGDGRWSTRPHTPVPPGSMRVTASERDAAGNVGTSAPVLFTVIPTIAAAGDIACPPGRTPDPTHCQQMATSDLLVDGGYHRVLALGDNQYDNGELGDFLTSFDPSWGRVKNLISPAAGNHEYQDPAGGATGYFDYFDGVGQSGGPAGPRGEGWYDFMLGGWHFIALNSDCTFIPAGTAVHGCATGSPQESWLRATLAASSAACTIVYWHHPRYSSGNGGNATSMQAIWQDVADAGVELVLNGHSHGYERFAPLDGAGTPDPAGVQEIVVGTGGEDFYPVPGQTNTVAKIANVFGVLRLSLRPGAYDWRFVPIAGATATDSGSRTCH